MKRSSTIFLKAAIYLIGLAALALWFVLIPELAREEAASNSRPVRLLDPAIIGAYTLAIPFFTALFQALKVSTYIEKDHTFTAATVNAIKNIKLCAAAFGLMLLTGIILIRLTAPSGEDVAGPTMVALILTFTASVIATAAAVLQRLLQDVVDLKSENDATV